MTCLKIRTEMDQFETWNGVNDMFFTEVCFSFFRLPQLFLICGLMRM